MPTTRMLLQVKQGRAPRAGVQPLRRPRCGSRGTHAVGRLAAHGLALLAVACAGEADAPLEVAVQRAGITEEGEWAPGGQTTNQLLLGSGAFSAPAANLPNTHRSPFFTGNSFFNQNWVQAPASTTARDGLGPTFNARSCSGCHFKDGRGAPPAADDPESKQTSGLLFRLSIPGSGTHGEPKPDPNYGGQLQPFALADVPAEGQATLEYSTREGNYGDGTAFSLREPHYAIDDLAYGPLDDEIRISPRVAPAVAGMGLLEAIPEEAVLAHADPQDDDEDGISGRTNRVWDVDREEHVLGRFGWKAEQPTVEQQTAAAFLGDLGITSRLFPKENCPQTQAACGMQIHGGEPELADNLLDAVVFYGRTLAPPVREDWDDDEVLRGKGLFHWAGCASCHVPHFETGESDIEELAFQSIWPYTDLLLHDMGPDLADNRPVFEADGQEWRTPPLWGIGRIEEVNGHLLLLHDGRARGFAEAILWHGGEGETAKERFRNLPSADREALLHFLASL